MSSRKIVVKGATFLWRRRHVHTADFEIAPCVEKVTIYREDYRQSPLRLIFRKDDNYQADSEDQTARWCLYGAGDGVIWLSTKPQHRNLSINLNRPAVIAALITYFLENGWEPHAQTRPYEVDKALTYLDVIPLPNDYKTTV